MNWLLVHLFGGRSGRDSYKRTKEPFHLRIEFSLGNNDLPFKVLFFNFFMLMLDPSKSVSVFRRPRHESHYFHPAEC